MPKRRLFTVVRAWSLLSITVLAQGSSCLPKFDMVLRSFDSAIATLAKQSASWQETLAKLEQDLVAQGQSTLANEVQSLMNRGIATGGVELRCNADFVGNRMREALENIRARLEKLPRQPPRPYFCEIDPTTIDLRLPADRRSSVNVYGYNFDVASVQALLFDHNGSSISLDSWTNSPTHYLMTLNTVNPPFSPTSLRVVFRLPGDEERSIGITQPDPCGAVGQPCCNDTCKDAGAACVNGVCELQITDVLIRGTICGLGHAQLLPSPTCDGQTINENAPNGDCPSGWQFVRMCDMGAPGGTQFFACLLTADKRITDLPAGVLCGYGHTDNFPNSRCSSELTRNGCPPGFQYMHFGDLGASAGHGFFGCVAGHAIQLTKSAPSAPPGTLCGLSHTCNNLSHAHQCGGALVRPNNPASCPNGYALVSYGDLGASAGQGQYACVKQ